MYVGLVSYNILLNPKYKEDFAISDSFAHAHRRVHSIVKFMVDKSNKHPVAIIIIAIICVVSHVDFT